MNAFLEWMSPTRWIILSVLALCLITTVVGYGEWRANAAREAEHNAMQVKLDALEKAVLENKVKAANELAAKANEVLELERRVNEAESKLEITYEKRRMDSKAASVALDAAAARHGGQLRDPNAAGCRGGGDSPEVKTASSADSGATDTAGTGGLLSVQLSDLLRGKLRRADEINDAYAICRADAIMLREQFNDP